MLYNTKNNRELAIFTDEYKGTFEIIDGKRKRKQEYIGQRISIDEDKLDLYDYYDEIIPTWDTEYDIKDYSDLIIYSFDIETTGGVTSDDEEPDYVNHRICMIGVKNQNGDSIYFDAIADEIYGIQNFFKLLKLKKPDILCGYNIFDFDLRFIIGRCKILGIPCPLRQEKLDNGKLKIKTRRTVINKGRMHPYNPIFIDFDDRNHHCAIIDLYHEVLQWDYTARTLTSYRLKHAPVQIGLIHSSEVIDLPYEDMLINYANWNQGGKELTKKYLESDLYLTKLLADFLIPSIYFQKKYLNWKLQSVASSGNGSKWNAIIQNQYPNDNPLPEPKTAYKGALTIANAGLYGQSGYECAKYDVTSLYPSVIELYGITSIKDTEKKQLSLMRKLRLQKIELSKIKNPTPSEKGLLGTTKIFINSGYGFFGTQGMDFNDYTAAALTTAYARAVFKLMVKYAVEFGAQLASCDTDGIIVLVKKGDAQKCHDFIQSRLPGHNTNCPIQIKLEWVADYVYVPPREGKIKDDDTDSGLKKNYIIINKDAFKGKITPLDYNGQFTKRDRSKLEREFTPNIIYAYCVGGLTLANDYYDQIIKGLKNKSIGIDAIQKDILISKSNKKYVEQGLGLNGEKIQICKSFDTYNIGKKGQTLKSVDVDAWCHSSDTEKINWQYYVDKIDLQYQLLRKYFLENH